jgi:uncharacterized membrane protein YfcA
MTLYVASFFATLFFSALFATGGMGSSVVLIPILAFLGVDFNLAKAVGLFINSITTSTASFLNWRRQLLDFSTITPFIIASVSCAPIGTYCASIWDVHYIKLFFVIFLFFSSAMMFFRGRPAHEECVKCKWAMFPLGLGVGFLAGLLGIGGGALIIPTLFAMGFSSRQIAINASFMIPFSTMSAFLSYAGLITIDWTLIGVTTIGGISGGFVGNRIMHAKLRNADIKNVLCLVLCLVGLKMLYDILAV